MTHWQESTAQYGASGKLFDAIDIHQMESARDGRFCTNPGE